MPSGVIWQSNNILACNFPFYLAIQILFGVPVPHLVCHLALGALLFRSLDGYCLFALPCRSPVQWMQLRCPTALNSLFVCCGRFITHYHFDDIVKCCTHSVLVFLKVCIDRIQVLVEVAHSLKVCLLQDVLEMHLLSILCTLADLSVYVPSTLNDVLAIFSLPVSINSCKRIGRIWLFIFISFFNFIPNVLPCNKSVGGGGGSLLMG